MTPSELQAVLKDFYLERLALLMRHEASARLIGDYDVNNAYQYVVSREETHVSWLQHAMVDEGMQIPGDPSAPSVSASGKDALSQLTADDARGNGEFVKKWKDKIELLTNARHKGMLRVILGEMLEHQRIFDQASQGRKDIIGTSLPIHERRGKVLPTRWVGQ